MIPALNCPNLRQNPASLIRRAQSRSATSSQSEMLHFEIERGLEKKPLECEVSVYTKS